MTRQELKAKAKERIKGKVGILFLISLVVYGVSLLANIVPGIGSLAMMIVITPAFSFATVSIYLNIAASAEYKPQVKELFSKFEFFWLAFKVTFFTGLFTFLWSLLFYIPGMVKYYSYSQAMRIAVENPGIGALEAIDRSKKLMNGNKMKLFVLDLSFIGWMILGGFTFGLLYIWLTPYMSTAQTMFYNDIKPQPAAAEPATEEVAAETPAAE